MATPPDYRLVHMLRALTPDAGLLFQWLRHAERGTRCGYVLVLVGGARSGKILIAVKLLVGLFGARHVLAGYTLSRLLDRHALNDTDVVVCNADDARDPSSNIRALTQLAAQDTIECRPLNQGAVTVANCTNSIAIGCHEHAIPHPDSRVGVVRLSDRTHLAAFAAAMDSDAALATLREELHDLWAPVRRHVRARAIAVFWHSLTAHLYAPGGAGRKRDRAAFEADFT